MVCRDEVDINLNIELESFLSSQALLGQTSSQVAEQVILTNEKPVTVSFNQSAISQPSWARPAVMAEQVILTNEKPETVSFNQQSVGLPGPDQQPVILTNEKSESVSFNQSAISQALLGQTSSQVAEQVMMFPPMRSHAESASFNQSGTRKLVTV